MTSTNRLGALLAPRSVALVGASATAGKLTARPLTFLRRHGFAGEIHPVNPGRSTVMGLPAHASVEGIGEPVEHATILVGTEHVAAALEDCARAGVVVASVLADGFAEAGPDGAVLQERLVAIAREAGILLIGPNSTGVVGTRAGFACTTNAAFGADRLLQGRLAVLSQSGSVIGTLLSRGQARGIGFSAFVSVGNEAAAGIGHLGRLLVDDADTDGVLLFMETIRDPDALEDFAARARAAGKPVAAYMIGRSDEGQALSVSHTGALTGSSEAVSAFLRAIGIREVEAFETLIEAPRVLAAARLPEGRPRAVTVVSTTGGGGAMVIDQIAARGIAIGSAGAAARSALSAEGIPLGHGKLIDVTLAGANYAAMRSVVSTLMADPATGLLLVAIGSSAQFDPELAVRPIVDAVAERRPGDAPVMAFPLPHAPQSLAMLEEGGVPSFATVETCAETVALFLRPPRPSAREGAALPDTAAALLATAEPGTMDEVAAGAVFEALGVPRPAHVVLPADGALPRELPFPFPVVAKLVSADLPHKTEAGAIAVGIADDAALTQAIAQMRETAERHRPGMRLSGILVQEMCSGVGEALVGLTRDPLVGPVVTVGMGGIATEIYRDTAVRPAPVMVETARAMLDEVAGFALLCGFRGRPEGDLDALAEAVAAISQLAASPLVGEAEVNPLLVRPHGEGVVLLDALIRRV